MIGTKEGTMGPIGMQEMVVIFLVALVLFGPKKLPELGKTLAKAVTEFRRAQSDLKATFEREMHSIEKETEALKEETRQAAVDLSIYSSFDFTGNSGASESTSDHPTVGASVVPGAESNAERNTQAEATQGVQGTVPRSSESTAALASAPDQSNPLPEFVQTGKGGATKPADAELPSIV
jgi:sec-independent protein translocase protein TatA